MRVAEWVDGKERDGNRRMKPTTLNELQEKFGVGEIPVAVRMCQTVRSDIPGSQLVCWAGQQYRAQVNRLGAVAAVTGIGVLGLKPGEFEVLSWTTK